MKKMDLPVILQAQRGFTLIVKKKSLLQIQLTEEF